MVEPKVEEPEITGTRYRAKDRAKERDSEWSFEEQVCSLEATNMILVRVVVAQIENNSRLQEILWGLPVRQSQPGLEIHPWHLQTCTWAYRRSMAVS